MPPAETGPPSRDGLAPSDGDATLERLRRLNHEVNQPLAAIVANAAAALRWLRRCEPELGEAGAAVERILAEAARAADIVRRAAER